MEATCTALFTLAAVQGPAGALAIAAVTPASRSAQKQGIRPGFDGKV
jgi:hypothetical protein